VSSEVHALARDVFVALSSNSSMAAEAERLAVKAYELAEAFERARKERSGRGPGSTSRRSFRPAELCDDFVMSLNRILRRKQAFRSF